MLAGDVMSYGVFVLYLFLLWKRVKSPENRKIVSYFFQRGILLANHRDDGLRSASKKIPLDVGQTRGLFVRRTFQRRHPVSSLEFVLC